MQNHYLQSDEFSIIRTAPNADNYFPALGSQEFVVLDADIAARHVYIRCSNIDEAKKAINDTLHTTLSQKFYVARSAQQQ